VLPRKAFNRRITHPSGVCATERDIYRPLSLPPKDFRPAQRLSVSSYQIRESKLSRSSVTSVVLAGAYDPHGAICTDADVSSLATTPDPASDDELVNIVGMIDNPRNSIGIHVYSNSRASHADPIALVIQIGTPAGGDPDTAIGANAYIPGIAAHSQPRAVLPAVDAMRVVYDPRDTIGAYVDTQRTAIHALPAATEPVIDAKASAPLICAYSPYGAVCTYAYIGGITR